MSSLSLCAPLLGRFAAVPWLLGLAASVAPITRSTADTVELSGGGHVSGIVKRVDAEPSPYVVVKLEDELYLKLPESRVRRVVKSDELAEYRRLVVAAGDDAERHYRLAIWCKTQVAEAGLPLLPQYRYHMQRAIALDPEHEDARASLKYVRHRGGWAKYADVKRAEGLISVAGRWKLPEVEAAEQRKKQTDVQAKKWIRKVSRLCASAQRGNAEALAELRAIEDPLAAEAVARELDASRGNRSQNRQLRSLWLSLLSKFQNQTAVKALVKAGVEESDDVIREAALESLQQYGRSSAIATYTAMLKSNDNGDVLRAARALSFFPDPELAMTYVDALVTSHKKVEAPRAGTNAGFSSNGSGGFATGGKPKVIVRNLKNPPALTLLKMIEPGVDFGYNESRWREYFAHKWASYSGDLRRDR